MPAHFQHHFMACLSEKNINLGESAGIKHEFFLEINYLCAHNHMEEENGPHYGGSRALAATIHER